MNTVPIPISDPIASPARKEFIERKQRDPLEGKVTQPWVDYFTQQGDAQSTSPSRIAQIPLYHLDLSVSPTEMAGVGVTGGAYRINYYARIMRPGAVSSSLIVTFDWTDLGVACSFSGAAMTGNTVTTLQSETLLVEVDNLSPIRYSTTYASVGVPSMEYKLMIVLEAIWT